MQRPGSAVEEDAGRGEFDVVRSRVTGMVRKQGSRAQDRQDRRGPGEGHACGPASSSGGLGGLKRLFELHADDRAHPRLLHRDPVDPVRGLDRARIVRDHDELRFGLEVL